jgi:hypothetical protein
MPDSINNCGELTAPPAKDDLAHRCRSADPSVRRNVTPVARRPSNMPLIEDEPPTVIDEQLMIIAVQHAAQQWPERF